MRKHIIAIGFVFLAGAFHIEEAQARLHSSSEKYFHITAMLGSVLSPHSLRVGSGAIEFGILTYEHMGLVWIISIDKNFFGSLGPTLSLNDSMLGFYASVGTEFFDLSWINFRFEAFSTTSTRNYTSAGVMVGANIVF